MSIINLDAIDLSSHAHGERFSARFGRLSQALGAKQLGYRLTIVPPGKSAWPFHRHHGNEEMVLILDGTGTLRLDDATHSLRPGDVVALTAGGPAHQIINTGEAELRYLAVSTMHEPDVVEYPDSNKFAVFCGSAPGGKTDKRSFAAAVPLDCKVDYWEGED